MENWWDKEWFKIWIDSSQKEIEFSSFQFNYSEECPPRNKPFNGLGKEINEKESKSSKI